MRYRISFVPKKTGQAVGPNAPDQIATLFKCIAVYRTDPGWSTLIRPDKGIQAEKVWGQVKHLAREVIEYSNLRTICAPNEELKATQRAVLRLLERIPIHRAAHGFVKWRDSKTCAQAHTLYWGKKANHLVILNMDAKNFFHSVTSVDVRKALEAHGIPPKNITQIIETCMVRADAEMALEVVNGLTELLRRRGRLNDASLVNAINVTKEILMAGQLGQSLTPPEFTRKLAFLLCQSFLSTGPGVTTTTRFLPQGAPSSPFLSNLMMKIVDIRLNAMARSFDGFYTRYADDLTISWLAPTKGKIIDGMYRCTQEVLGEYHLLLNRQKKRVMGRGKRQEIVGYCVNSGRPTISQKYRKRIKAALHNEMVRGSASFQSGKRKPLPGEKYDGAYPTPARQHVLAGYIGYVQTVHPEEAARRLDMLRHVTMQSARTLGGISENIAESTIEIDLAPTVERVLGDPSI